MSIYRFQNVTFDDRLGLDSPKWPDAHSLVVNTPREAGPLPVMPLAEPDVGMAQHVETSSHADAFRAALVQIVRDVQAQQQQNTAPPLIVNQKRKLYVSTPVVNRWK